jgi:large subunit ribosomal protein L2
MGKRIRQQRHGRGTPQWRNRGHLRVAPAKYANLKLNETYEGYIVEMKHDPGRWVPLAHVVIPNVTDFWIPAGEGMYVGQKIQIGPNAQPLNGNILPLASIPEGTQVFNIELRPGDGGKLVRAGGSYAIVVGKSGKNVIVQLPSGAVKQIDGRCRATIGIVAGAGREEKPLLKAGNSYYKWRVKAKKWPIVRGVAMNAVNHPHGGGSHQSPSFPTTRARESPPGQKVGHIAARCTGRGCRQAKAKFFRK